MRTFKVPFVVVVSVALTASLVAIFSQHVVAQADPFSGTWVLNVAKSKYSPGPPPKDQTVVYEATAQNLKISAKGTDASGKPIMTSYSAGYDGKDYPVTGNADYDATTLKRVDSHTIEFTRKKAGKVVQTGSIVVSKDGKTRTTTTMGTDAKGQKINNVAVYEKK